MTPHSDGFTPISPNPYIVGNPVRDRAMFFGREAEFELVRRRFEHSARGGLLVFCGERRSGKTSILFQILDRRLGPDFIPVLIDMQSMATGSEVEFLTRISVEVLNALGSHAAGIEPPHFVPGTSHSATFQAFIRSVLRSQPGKNLVLLFDEYELFENKIDAKTLDQDVLNILASLMENHSVFLIFTGSQHLEERRRDYWGILGKSIYKTISYLERDDATKLVTVPVAGRVDYEPGVVDAIFRLAAGQPFYTQAICQNLVDHLNEHRTHVATQAALLEVVDAIVNNPLPQMIFLWDGLERDEKLTLALLAEALPDENAYATADDLRRTIRLGGYPLDLDNARLASALEKLFKSEMVSRRDEPTPPGYAFRMDLWRRWIRRQHSVWQVMREAGLEIRPGGAAQVRRQRWWIAAGVVALVSAALLWASRQRPQAPEDASDPSSRVEFSLQTVPDHAVISRNGQRMGIGSYQDALAVGPEHKMQLTAPGYADTEITVRLEAGVPVNSRIELRALRGDLRIVTRPAGAEITVDGQPHGTSPLHVRDLPVPVAHRVTASLAGYGPVETHVTLEPGAVTTADLALSIGRGELLVITDPAGAEVRVDGAPRGRSPARIEALPFGRHVVAAIRDGHLPAETTLVVSASTREIHLVLSRMPPGELVVQGDVPATIYIDGRLVVENVQNSGARELEPGEHMVRVVLLNNEVLDYPIEIRTRERAIYDFSRNTVTRRRQDTP